MGAEAAPPDAGAPPPTSSTPATPSELTPAQQVRDAVEGTAHTTDAPVTAPAPIVTAESLVNSVQDPPAAPSTAGTDVPAGDSALAPLPLDPLATTQEQHVAPPEATTTTPAPPTESPDPTLAPPPRAPPRRKASVFSIPPHLVAPGTEMLKVSAKSARRVKPRKVWLELGGATPDDGELGLEVGVGLVGGQDVRLCWEKNGLGIGLKKEASVPLSRIRDLRFGTQGSPYRTSLQISADVEPRWITVIYVLPQSSARSVLSSGVNYKLVHFIAPTLEVLNLWKSTLEKFKEGRVAKAVVSGDAATEGEDGAVEADDEKKVVKKDEVFQICARLGMGMSRQDIDKAFTETAAPNDFLDFSAFQKFVKRLKRRQEVEEIFRTVVGSEESALSQEGWARFLIDTQKIVVTPALLSKSFTKYADRTTNLITLDGFSSYLMSSDNSAIKDESQQDMTRPITEYFISSSHNTYLVGSQFQGESTVEGYIRALQQGCRCVELDVWDGDDGEPIVTHGRTLTSKISALHVLQAIAQYAFLASQYPVVLSMEVHCDLEQQDKLVETMKSTLGDRLISKRIDQLEGDIEKLPSPEDLKGKILLKAKNKFVTTSNTNGVPLALVTSNDTSSTESSTSSDSDLKKVFKAVRQTVSSPRPSIGGTRSARSSFSFSSNSTTTLSTSPKSESFFSRDNNRLSATLSSAAEPAAPPPPAKIAKDKDVVMSSALLSLLVYTVGVKARGFNKKETYAPTHVISVGESSLTKMIKDEGARQDFVGHNRGHLTRAYPKGSRLTSSNFCPHHMWAAGVQLVALNWQTFDIGMELNSAMFSRVNRHGYVLKPELLRKKGVEKDKAALVRSQKYILELEIISAQQLPRPRDLNSNNEADVAPVDPFVEVSLYQPNVILPIKKRTSVILGNAFNPVFKSSFRIEFSSNPAQGMLDLVFLRLEVLNARGNVKAATEEGKGDFLGAYAIGVGTLLSGYRHVPLYDNMGDQHLFSTLFIKSNIVDTGNVG